jgi:hypothetical protein
MEKVHSVGQITELTVALGLTVDNMVKVYTLIPRDNHEKDFGLMAKEKNG